MLLSVTFIGELFFSPFCLFYFEPPPGNLDQVKFPVNDHVSQRVIQIIAQSSDFTLVPDVFQPWTSRKRLCKCGDCHKVCYNQYSESK